jgi:MarR family transcriptional regulator, lower aerobic nicotinate degradation pathway regulator
MSAAPILADSTPWPLADRPGFLVRRLHQIHVALFMDRCAQFDVTPVQYSLMSALSVRVKSDQTTLSGDIDLDRTTVTGALTRLEARGLIRRVTSSEDRRARECTLTPAGVDLLHQMESAARAAHRDTIATLDPAEQATLMDLLRRLVTAHGQRGAESSVTAT